MATHKEEALTALDKALKELVGVPTLSGNIVTACIESAQGHVRQIEELKRSRPKAKKTKPAAAA